MNVIEVTQLRKEYRRGRRRRILAVDGLDLSVPRGSVFGLLGPNGSGKTTTLRCLIGLASPTSGACSILGADCGSELPRVIRRVGSVVEAPSFLESFSARRTLQLLGGLYEIEPRRVEDVLERVGLAERAGDPVRAYSFGMRQRLGLAAALLKDPEVLILDEPTNGLDPAGIVQVRDLLRGLADQGCTVLVAGHVLPEIEQVCDAVAILSVGRAVASGSLDEVRARAGVGGLLVRAEPLERARAVLAAAGVACTLGPDHLLVRKSAIDGANVSRILAEAGLYPAEIRPVRASLEEAFLGLTRAELPEEVA